MCVCNVLLVRVCDRQTDSVARPWQSAAIPHATYVHSYHVCNAIRIVKAFRRLHAVNVLDAFVAEQDNCNDCLK